ncbi:MAG: CPBP family intramembrane metalloprotease, partial [Planctomycetes bacterium]|nr:CPBP family intramembrane metalloprotease [Planctomycetota bacterium]
FPHVLRAVARSSHARKDAGTAAATSRWGSQDDYVLFAICHLDPLGALVFGYVMCAIYLRTQSLIAPILIHALNNLCAWLLEIVASDAEPMTIEGFRDVAWIGLVGLGLGLPWFVWFIRNSHSPAESQLPYFAKQVAT